MAESELTRRIKWLQRASWIFGMMFVLAVITTIVAGLTTINAQSTQATVEFQATVSGLQIANERAWIEAFQEIPTYAVSPMPADILATATAWAVPLPPELVAAVFDDGVEMVQVPAGCFLMGTGFFDYEQPVHEICFEAPFWIDRYEVTNEQFEQFGGLAPKPGDWPDPQQPRTSVTWFEARDFCDARDGATGDPLDVGVRLPTEAEWEYAARGPNSSVYPWGNEFVEENVVYSENSNGEAADVGSRPSGTSWIGAYDMSGNVWEWVSTANDNFDHAGEFPYPYDPNDGREDLEGTDVLRGLRGGSFGDFEILLRAANRTGNFPDFGFFNMGFRCALSQ